MTDPDLTRLAARLRELHPRSVAATRTAWRVFLPPPPEEEAEEAYLRRLLAEAREYEQLAQRARERAASAAERLRTLRRSGGDA